VNSILERMWKEAFMASFAVFSNTCTDVLRKTTENLARNGRLRFGDLIKNLPNMKQECYSLNTDFR
jgi:hypothetical protein